MRIGIEAAVPAHETRAVLESLPDWFGRPQSLSAYAEEAARLHCVTLRQHGRLVGIVSLKPATRSTCELAVIGLEPQLHGKGFGRALIERGCHWMQDQGFDLALVATFGPSIPDPYYARTLAFYEAMGFLAVMELKNYPDADTPTLYLVKPLPRRQPAGPGGMMDFVLVLIAAPGSGFLLAALAAAFARQHPSVGRSAPVWLADGEALEIAFSAAGPSEARAIRDAIAANHAAQPVDVCVVPAASRRKRLLVADMDSTVIGQECIDELADIRGLKPEVSAITERAMRGELPFEAALQARLELLVGITEAELEQVWRDRVTLNPGARTLVATMRKAGASTALVSGGFTFFTSRVAAKAGFDLNHANVLELVDGQLTGRLARPILGREAKLATLVRLRTDLGLAGAQTLAVGDGANDLAMIKAAGLGVAYRAKPIVAAEADAAIEHGDLTALLFLQGYRRQEFVTSL